MQDLTITLIQTELHWQSAGANLATLEEKIWQLEDPPDLVVLPEMFNTGFSMDVEKLAEPMNLTTFKWLKQMAAQTQATVTGSMIVKDSGNFYNRLIWMEPDGNYSIYDKRHLFRMAEEHHFFTAGDQRLVTTLKGWRVHPLICYDLRFPVWSRNRVVDQALQYDLLIYVANWPAARVGAWDTLLKARAIENLAYCVGVNRIGTDGNQVAYNGHSQVIDPKGEVLLNLGENEEIMTTRLSMAALTAYREKFPAHYDGDNFELY